MKIINKFNRELIDGDWSDDYTKIITKQGVTYDLVDSIAKNWIEYNDFLNRDVNFYPRRDDLFFDATLISIETKRVFVMPIPLAVVDYQSFTIRVKPLDDEVNLPFSTISLTGTNAGIRVYSGEGETDHLRKIFNIYKRYFCVSCAGFGCHNCKTLIKLI